MKMIGISVRSTMRSWRSRPLRSGSVTSSTRQLGPSMRERRRKSSADAKVSGRQPAARISNSSDSRTDTSSSTTNTTGELMSPPRTENTAGPALEQARADDPVSVGGDEHDWNLLPPACQFLLQVGARHPGHRDVEEQTVRFADDVRREERLGG